MNLSLTTLIVSERTFIVEKAISNMGLFKNHITVPKGQPYVQGLTQGWGKSPGPVHKILNIFYLF